MKFIKIIVLLMIVYSSLNSSAQNEFINNQLQNPRVLQASTDKFYNVQQLFKSKGLEFPMKEIFWRAFKLYKTLELWAYSADSQKYILVKTYPICELVGDLGPKRQAGDFQTPEGFYYIDIFNPMSKYHLSLHVDYPNASDRILGESSNLGGDIYIHGGCETVGCIPMTDSLIDEIYVISASARNCGLLKIPIHIFPMRMTVKNMNILKQNYFKGNVKVLNFWSNMKEGFDIFEKNKLLPNISIDNISGKYIFE